MNIPECIAVNLGLPVDRVIAYINDESTTKLAKTVLDLQTLCNLLTICKRDYPRFSGTSNESTEYMNEWIRFGLQAMCVAKDECEIIRTFSLCPQDDAIIILAVQKLKILYLQHRLIEGLLAEQEP